MIRVLYDPETFINALIVVMYVACLCEGGEGQWERLMFRGFDGLCLEDSIRAFLLAQHEFVLFGRFIVGVIFLSPDSRICVPNANCIPGLSLCTSLCPLPYPPPPSLLHTIPPYFPKVSVFPLWFPDPRT